MRRELTGWRFWVYLVIGAVIAVLVQTEVLTDDQGSLAEDVVDTIIELTDEGTGEGSAGSAFPADTPIDAEPSPLEEGAE